MINFQDRTLKYGNRTKIVLLMPGLLWEAFIINLTESVPLQILRVYCFGLSRFSYALSLLVERQNTQRSYIY